MAGAYRHPTAKKRLPASVREDMKVRVSLGESCVPGHGHGRCEASEASLVSFAAD